MSSSLLISVVTPVYNGERYLRECIESVLTQSYTNWEYIIVNNASTDHTLAIIEEYARSESRIRITATKRCWISFPITTKHLVLFLTKVVIARLFQPMIVYFQNASRKWFAWLKAIPQWESSVRIN